MAFGFLHPRYVARRTFDASHDELFAAVHAALDDLHWGYKILWGKEFSGRVPTRGWSWHHEFRVTFPSDGVAEAESRSAYNEILFDFGRNRRHVETLFARVEQVLARRATGSSRPDAVR